MYVFVKIIIKYNYYNLLDFVKQTFILLYTITFNEFYDLIYSIYYSWFKRFNLLPTIRLPVMTFAFTDKKNGPCVGVKYLFILKNIKFKGSSSISVHVRIVCNKYVWKGH